MRAFSLLIVACGMGWGVGCSDGTGGDGGGTGLDANTGGGETSLGDGPGGDASDSSGSDGASDGQSGGGCTCMTGWSCVPTDGGGWDCVPGADASAETALGETSGDGTAGSDASGSDASGSDAGLDVAATDLTCTQIGQCVEDQCNANQVACGLNCGAGAKAEVTAKVTDLATCVGSKCQNGLCKGKVTTQCMNDCVGAQCGALLMACFEDGSGGGNSCGSALGCFDGCDKDPKSNHFTCMSKCYNGLTSAGKAQLKAFNACVGNAPAGSDVMSLCAAEYSLCATGGSAGGSSCADVATCAAKCPTGASGCFATCLATGDKAAQGQYTEMQTCFAGATDMTTCFGKLQSCANPSGSGKCVAIQPCTEACKKGFGGGDDKGSCTVGCLHEASAVGAAAFLDLLKCVAPNCPMCGKDPTGCNSCLAAKCDAQLKTCTAN